MMYGFDIVIQWKCGACVRGVGGPHAARELRPACGAPTVYSVLAAAAFTLSLLLLLTACGGGAAGSRAGAPVPPNTSGAPKPPSIGGAPTQSQPATETASQPSPALMAMLRAELMRVLAEREAAGARAGAPMPPTGAGAAAVLTYSEDSAALTWGYYCPGDYNQDGQVGVADLTPLGMHYGEVSPDGLGHPFPPDSIGAVVDGNGDGLIGIADVSPIGANFGARVEGYRVYQAPDAGAVPVEPDAPNGGGSALIATVPFKAAGGPALRTIYTAQVVPTETAQWYWVRPYQGAVDGAASNGVTVALPPNEPPTPVLIATGVAETPAHIVWDATGSTDEDGDVVRYAWDFDDDGVYEYESPADADALPFPLDQGADGAMDYYYYAPGTYWVGVRVTDDDGASSTIRTAVTIAEVAKWQTSIPDAVYRAPGSNLYGITGPAALLDVEGQPALIYTRGLDEPDPGTGATIGIAYLRANDVFADDWPEPQMIVLGPKVLGNNSEGFYGAAAIVLSRPAFSFTYSVTDEVGTLLKYVLAYKRADDNLGETWLPQLAIEQTIGDPEAGVFPKFINPGSTLAVVEGKPALLGAGYGDDCGYIRALDAFGTTWAEQQVPGKGLWARSDIAVGMIAGLPARVEWANSSDLLYSRALDADALAWSSDVLVDKHEVGADYMCLIEAAGTPAVVYYDTITKDLKYRRATDATGARWADPVVLSAQADGQQRAAMVDGRPAVLYGDRITGEVKFIAANDPEGRRWGNPISLPAEFEPHVLTDEASGSSRLINPFSEVAGSPAFAALESVSSISLGSTFTMRYLMYR